MNMDEENMSESDLRDEDTISNLARKHENPKRLKTDATTENKPDEPQPNQESSTSGDGGEGSASIAKASGSRLLNEEPVESNAEEEATRVPGGRYRSILRPRNVKARNYRNNLADDDSTQSSVNESNEEPPAALVVELANQNSDSDAMSDASDLDSLSPTVIHETDTDSEGEEHPVLKKEKPKHSWFMVPEVFKRQIGYTSKKQSSELFQRRCYGSLHCVQRLELMYKLDKHGGCVNSLNFHPNGSLLASGSDDLKVVIWDWKLGTPLMFFETKHRGNVFQSKFLPLSGDLHIATCARDGQVRLAQVSAQEGLRCTRKLGSHRGPCHKLAILPEQPHVVISVGEDGLVLSHDVRNSKPDKVVTVRNERGDVALYSVGAHPLNSHDFCVSGRDHIVRIYDQRKCSGSSPPLNVYYPKTVKKMEDGLNTHVTCALFNHNGTEILASYNDDDIYIFDVNSSPGSFVHQYQGHRNGATIKGVNFFGPKSEYIVSGSDCGNVYFWEKNTEAIVNWMLADDNGVVNCLEPHPQLPFLCTSGLDWDVKVWVPSCENDPIMAGLAETIRDNSKARTNWSTATDMNESRMLWMLWRHLRSSGRTNDLSNRSDEDNPMLVNFANLQRGSSSSSASDFDSLEDSDDEDLTSGCTTS